MLVPVVAARVMKANDLDPVRIDMIRFAARTIVSYSLTVGLREGPKTGLLSKGRECFGDLWP